MKKFITYGVVATLLLTNAIAQSSEEDIPSDALVVIGNEQRVFDFVNAGELAGPRDIITLEELAYEHPDDTLELFSKVPGVNLARYNQGVINTDIGIRGFGTDGVTPHAKLLIDGVPSNIHNGYSELDQLFPMAIGGIEVFKGTSDLRYGLYNVAGNYNVYTRDDIANELQVTVDSFGSYELQAYSGSQVGALTQSYFLGYRDAKGFRDHTDLEKYSFSGKWTYEIDDSLSVGASARFSSYEGDSPGYINDASRARNNRTLSEDFARQDGGEKEVNQFALFADKEFYDAGVQLSLKAYYNDIYRNRFVRFSAGGSLRNRIDDQQISGVIANANWDITDTFSLKAGLDFQYQDVIEQRFNAIADASSVTGFRREPDLGSVRRDQSYSLNNFGGYIGVEHEATAAFRWNTGLRFDSFSGNFINNSTGVREDADQIDVVLQPKLNLFYDITNELTAFANYGRTFQAPTGADFYGDADVNINDGGEIGVVYNFTDRSNVRLSVWNQVAEDEFQVDQFNGGFVEIGKISRGGVEIAFNYEVNDKFTLWGNYGYTESEIKNDSSGFPGTEGNEVRGTPNHTYSFGASYDITDSLTARLTFDGQGKYYINENNEGGRFGDYNTLNLGLDYDTKYGLISLQVNNLADAYNEYVYDFTQNGSFTIHSPGDGINASLSYKYEF